MPPCELGIGARPFADKKNAKKIVFHLAFVIKSLCILHLQQHCVFQLLAIERSFVNDRKSRGTPVSIELLAPTRVPRPTLSLIVTICSRPLHVVWLFCSELVVEARGLKLTLVLLVTLCKRPAHVLCLVYIELVARTRGPRLA